MKKYSILFTAALLLIMLLVPVSGLADMGGFAGDTDFGGFDFGGSDIDFGGSDYGSDYGGGLILGSGGLFGGFGTVIIVVIVIVIVILSKRGKKGGSANKAAAPGGQYIPANVLRSVEELNAKDPAFNAAVLAEQVGNLYVRMQNAWTAKDMTPVRPYFTDALYNQFASQLEMLKKAGRTNYVDRIAVLGVSVRGWYTQGMNDILSLSVRTRIVDYTKLDVNGQLISGSETQEKFMEYEYLMIRPSDALTKETELGATTAVNCPNCGAPLDINNSAKCPYCDNVVRFEGHDWVIYQIKGISQRTGS